MQLLPNVPAEANAMSQTCCPTSPKSLNEGGRILAFFAMVSCGYLCVDRYSFSDWCAALDHAFITPHRYAT